MKKVDEVTLPHVGTIRSGNKVKVKATNLRRSFVGTFKRAALGADGNVEYLEVYGGKNGGCQVVRPGLVVWATQVTQ